MRTTVTIVAALACAAGCLSSQDHTTSSIEIPLQQTGADGSLYQLAGTFQIMNYSTGNVITVDASGDSPSLVVPRVPPGLTYVSLATGWTLQKSSDGGMTYTPVEAILSSSNPALLRVLANQPASTEFTFIIRNPTGTLTITFGVDPVPRELEGGMIISSGTLDYAAYSYALMDFAIFFDVAPTKNVLADGTKQLVFDTQYMNNAMEIYNDASGLLANTVAPAMAGGELQYTVSAKPDGTTEVQGSYSGTGVVQPLSTFNFGPHTLDVAVPTDADGYPIDEFFYDPYMPFTATTSFNDGDATMSGTFRMRFIPPG